MSLDLNAIKNRLNKLQNTKKKAMELWKPTPGKHQIRIVPYKFNKENPFIELYFHYNINNRTYLSPISFGRPDPIVEFSDKLKRMGDKDDYQFARKMQPKLRTFVPVLVRGEEGEGVRFWGFGKTVYQEILGYIADPDYGDITDIKTGRDIVVEITSAEDAGTSYPMTTIRVKPKETPLAETDDDIKKLIGEQANITDIYQELTYDELKEILNSWLNPDGDDSDKEESKEEEESVSAKELSKKKEVTKDEPKEEKSLGEKNSEWLKDDDDKEEEPKTEAKAPKSEKKKSEEVSEKKVDDVASAFDDLFAN